MVPIVLTAKSFLLYSSVTWLVSGVALGYMGKRFVKRQKQEIQQLRTLHQEQQDQISQLQAKLAETNANKATGSGQPTGTVTSNRHVGHNKVFFLKNLLEANMRLREDIQNEAFTTEPAVRTANEK